MEIGAIGIERWIRRTERPSQIPGRDHVHGPRRKLCESAGTEGRDIVAKFTVSQRLDTIACLGVEPELRAGADGNHIGIGRGRAQGTCRPGIARAHGDRDTGFYRRGVREGDGIDR